MKIIKSFIVIMSVIISSNIIVSVEAAEWNFKKYGYNREAARSYAVAYAKKYNKNWPSFESDCTNFVSQCVNYGSVPMLAIKSDNIKYSNLNDTYKCKDYWFCSKYTKKSPILGKKKTGWVYTSTWTVVDKPNSSNWYGFRNFFDTYVKTEQYNCSKKKRRNALCEDASIGDIIQVKGSSDKQNVHSMIVTGRVKADDGTWDLKLSYHSSDRVNESFKDFVYPAFAKSSETTYTLIKMTTIRGQ